MAISSPDDPVHPFDYDDVDEDTPDMTGMELDD